MPRTNEVLRIDFVYDRDCAYVDEFGCVSGAPPATLIVNAIRGAQAA
jgi:hypothetical protein